MDSVCRAPKLTKAQHERRYARILPFLKEIREDVVLTPRQIGKALQQP